MYSFKTVIFNQLNSTVWQTTIVPGVTRKMRATTIIATDRMMINAVSDPATSTIRVVVMERIMAAPEVSRAADMVVQEVPVVEDHLT